MSNVKEQLEKLVAQLVERGIFLDEALEAIEKRFIGTVLEEQKGNQTHTARRLGIHRNTLSRKVSQYKLTANGHRKRRR